LDVGFCAKTISGGHMPPTSSSGGHSSHAFIVQASEPSAPHVHVLQPSPLGITSPGVHVEPPQPGPIAGTQSHWAPSSLHVQDLHPVESSIVSPGLHALHAMSGHTQSPLMSHSQLAQPSSRSFVSPG